MSQCRLCGRSYDFLIDLFLNENTPHEISLITKINSFLPIKIEKENELPSKVCGKCVDQSLDAYDFIQTVLQTQEIFTGIDVTTKIPANCIKYGTTTISSASSKINVNPPRIPNKTKKMNMTEALKKLRNIGSHITISKKLIPETRPRRRQTTKRNYRDSDASSNDDSDRNNDDNNDPNFEASTILSDSDASGNDKNDVDYSPDRRIEQTEKSPKKKRYETKKSKYSIKIDGPPVFLCMKCNIKFETFVELKKHLSEENNCNMSEFVCTICQRLCETKKILTQHMKCHEEKEKFICDRCGKAYINHYSLDNHKLTQHGECNEEFPNVYKCRLCNQKFNSRNDLYVHTKNHNKKNDIDGYLCHTCGKCFSNNHNLGNHIRTHLDIRPFSCEFCPKTFRTRLLLRQHIHVHTGIKTFKCQYCPKEFAKSESLRIHRRKHPEAIEAEITKKKKINSNETNADETLDEDEVLVPT